MVMERMIVQNGQGSNITARIVNVTLERTGVSGLSSNLSPRASDRFAVASLIYTLRGETGHQLGL